MAAARGAVAPLMVLVLTACSGVAHPPARPPGRAAPPPARVPSSPAGIPPLPPFGLPRPPVTAPGAEHLAAPAVTPDATLAPDRWPDACALLTDADLRVLVPDETAVTRRGQPGEEATGGETPQPTSCRFDLARPTTPPGYPPDDVSVDVRAVGDHAVLAARFSGDERTAATLPPAPTGAAAPSGNAAPFRDYGVSLGADGSFWDGTEIESLVGDYLFWVAGSQSRPDHDPAADAQAWRDGVLTRAVSLLASKLR
ncbi:MAG TPA: hypothetical protein VGI06_11355 [Acidimicrobiales bacterium]